jgi:DNA-binding Xre family transcriptional regulator
MQHMIILNVRKVAEKQGYKNAHQLQLAAGLASHVATRLWRGEAQAMSFSVLNSLCRTLNCQPGKLLKYEPD